MNKTLKLHSYDGKTFYFMINNVENILNAFFYTCSGDECAYIFFNDGSYVHLDTGEETRKVSFGPEDVVVCMPDEIEWEASYAA